MLPRAAGTPLVVFCGDDETLVNLDPLTTQREHEHAFLASDGFPRLLAANNVTLA